MSNKTFLNHQGYIEHHYIGDQSYASVKKSMTIAARLASRLKTQGEDVMILADLTRLEKSTSESRKASLEALQSLPYDKIALFGGNLYVRHLANLIIKAAGKESVVKIFAARKQAEAWLRE